MSDIKDTIIQKKPEDIDEFNHWFKNKFDFDYITYKGYYDTATDTLKKNFERSQFWIDVKNELQNINDSYLRLKGNQLLTTAVPPDIYIKSLDSLLIKAYRKDILNNSLYPEEPESGWVNQLNWFQSINDILRTTIVVKYLDGVTYILEKLKEIASKNNCDFKYTLEAREEGYYAGHAGIKIELGLLSDPYQTRTIPTLVNVEIQITTELQEIIKSLLHKHYEENRKNPHPPKHQWQWDYHCDEFASNYLGHIVHYVEGMIVEIRDKQKQKK